jgi:hypothetical protein
MGGWGALGSLTLRDWNSRGDADDPAAEAPAPSSSAGRLREQVTTLVLASLAAAAADRATIDQRMSAALPGALGAFAVHAAVTPSDAVGAVAALAHLAGRPGLPPAAKLEVRAMPCFFSSCHHHALLVAFHSLKPTPSVFLDCCCSPHLAPLQVLRAVPRLACKQGGAAVVRPAAELILALASEPELVAVSVSLMTQLWMVHDRTFPALQVRYFYPVAFTNTICTEAKLT